MVLRLRGGDAELISERLNSQNLLLSRRKNPLPVEGPQLRVPGKEQLGLFAAWAGLFCRGRRALFGKYQGLRRCLGRVYDEPGNGKAVSCLVGGIQDIQFTPLG